MLILALLLSACTTHDIYDLLQEEARDNCNKLPDIDRSACLKRSQGDYNTYMKRREEAISGPKPG
ncbi:MAG TPA: hypothetical protein VJ603_06350 [Paucimonas sp.]|nr:hypothetical protein [Paucimonas sp.]